MNTQNDYRSACRAANAADEAQLREARRILAEIQQTGFSVNNRPRRKLVRIPTALALSPVLTGEPALLLLQYGETAAAVVLGLVALALFCWACLRVETVWR